MAAAVAADPLLPPTIASIRLTTYNSEVYEPAEDSFLLVDTLLAQLPRWAAAGTPPPAWCAALCSLARRGPLPFPPYRRLKAAAMASHSEQPAAELQQHRAPHAAGRSAACSPPPSPHSPTHAQLPGNWRRQRLRHLLRRAGAAALGAGLPLSGHRRKPCGDRRHGGHAGGARRGGRATGADRPDCGPGGGAARRR